MKSNNLGKYISLHRKINQITQSEVAEKLGFKGCQFISNIERGLSNIPADKIKKFAELIDVPYKRLVQFALEFEKNRYLDRIG